mmetsp:Transcript_67658/g.94077  ORF Transcript_67658/g.94077 Transcript_67658/m.94077 type:complete len:234 (-) Transcript_67658:216-917(-)
MERLELDTLALVAEQHHHQLQVGRIPDVLRHNVEVCAVQEKLGKKLQREPTCDVVLRVEKLCVGLEHSLVVLVQESRADLAVLREKILEGGEGIRSSVEVRDLHKLEELVHIVRVEDELCKVLVLDALPQNRAAVQRDSWVLIPANQHMQYLGVLCDVVGRHGRVGAMCASEEIVDDRRNILPCLKFKLLKVADELGDDIVLEDLDGELLAHLRARLVLSIAIQHEFHQLNVL